MLHVPHTHKLSENLTLVLLGLDVLVGKCQAGSAGPTPSEGQHVILDIVMEGANR